MKTKQGRIFLLLFLLLFVSVVAGCSTSRTLLYQSRVKVGGYYQQQIAKEYEDGTGSVTLIKKGEYPQWIPGVKTHFAYLERKPGNPHLKLWVAKQDGTNPVALTNFEIHFDYSWSPDGKWLVVSDSRDGNYEIYKIKRDGTQSIRLTNNFYTDQFPRWSPKGNKIVYVSTGGGANNKLFLINANGQGSPKQLTPSNLRIYASLYSHPCWSFDGSQVAFIAHSGTSFDVFTVDVASGKIQNITNKKRVFEHVYWYDHYIFFFDYNTLYRYDTKLKKIDPPSGLGSFPGETPHSPLSVNASHVFFSYAKDGSKPPHIYKVQHYTGQLTDIGEGSNPDIW
ncbi:MAG: hypothetical protein GXO76_15905 [Calditrichaeota bacterium]|nr:hypothetical protein [Calditrichota bacterium]